MPVQFGCTQIDAQRPLMMLKHLFLSSYFRPNAWLEVYRREWKERPAKGGARLNLAGSNGFHLPRCEGTYTSLE